MTELANCPFCGKPSVTLAGKWEGFCGCVTTGCPITLRKMTISQWQTRPTEKALQSALTTAQEENKWLEKHWDDCIDIVRELPTNSPLIEKARKLYAEWCDYYDAQSALNGGK